MKNQMIKTASYCHLLICLLVLISLNSCAPAEITQPVLPFSKFSTIDSCLDSNRTKKMAIPFLQDGLYGLSDYDGRLILSPKFKEIQLLSISFPYFWARVKDQLELYDLKGNQILDPAGAPIQHSEKFMLASSQPKEDYRVTFFGFGIENPVAERGISNEKPETLYLFLSEFSRPPFKFYYKGVKGSRTKDYFFKGGSFKVKTLDGRYTYLNEYGEELFDPMPKCKEINFGYVALENELGKHAIWNYEKNWQTDYIFSNIRASPNPTIFTANSFQNSKWLKAIIYDKGDIKMIGETEGFKVVSKEHSIYTKVSDGDTKHWLWDNIEFEAIKEIYSDKHFRMPNDRVALELNEEFLCTLEGDTLNRPSVKKFLYWGENLAYTQEKDSMTFLTGDGEVIVSFIGAIAQGGSEKFVKVINANKKYGLLGLDGKLMFPIEYEDIICRRESGFIFAQKNGVYKIYNDNGEQVSGLEIDEIETDFDFPSITCAINNFAPFKLKVDSTEYVVSTKLELLGEKNSRNPIIKKPDFEMSNKNALIQEDFQNCKLPANYSEFVIFEGQDFVHIFEISGKYISSVEGSYVKMDYTTVHSGVGFGGRQSTGIIIMKSKLGEKFWVRATDGLQYRMI